MKLVIVESPAKCKKIESYLGKSYKVIASFGHIRSFKNGLKSINKDKNYEPTYNLLVGKQKYVKNLRENIKKASEVILATDDDREGEAIAWHICEAFNLPLDTTKRIIFHEITKPAILSALENSTFVNMDKVNAQQSRQILDIMVGYTLSPLLWKHISRNSKSKLSAGRCQTPALRLIYEREKERKESPGKMVYDTTGNFTKKNMDFKLNKTFNTVKKMEGFLEESVSFEHIFSKTKVNVVEKKPPLPYTTSVLQQKASNELGFSPKQTMRYAQTLYESGLITYMRTDSKTYSAEFINKAKKFIKQNFKVKNEYINKNINSITSGNKKKVKKDTNAQEAHEAIRPTDPSKTSLEQTGKIGNREVNLYKLIWTNTLESCMSSAIYTSITGIISSPEKGKYRCSEELVKFPGWKIVRGYEKTNEYYNYILQFEEGAIMNYNKITSKISIKELKSHYGEAKLVQLLEKKGIGRPSTFSSLIDKIQERKYVLKTNVEGKKMNCKNFELIEDTIEEIEEVKEFGSEKNKLVIQPLGILVLEFLLKYFNTMFEYDYTKNMEDDLDLIEKGEKVWHTLCKECDNEMKKSSKDINTNSKTLIRIDEDHIYMIGKYGPVIKYEKDGETLFKNVKKDIDLDMLRKGEYKLDEIIELNPNKNGRIIGVHKNEEITIKNGKFGLYITYGGKNKSIKHLLKSIEEITLEDVIPILEKSQNSNPNVLKVLNEEISIRKGRYGPYVMYKTKEMKKPKFISMKKEPIENIDVDWVKSKL